MNTICKKNTQISISDLPVLEHHLTPRVKAAMLSINKLRNYVDAVYDVTIGYEEKYLPSDLSKRPKISFASKKNTVLL